MLTKIQNNAKNEKINCNTHGSNKWSPKTVGHFRFFASQLWLSAIFKLWIKLWEETIHAELSRCSKLGDVIWYLWIGRNQRTVEWEIEEMCKISFSIVLNRRRRNDFTIPACLQFLIFLSTEIKRKPKLVWQSRDGMCSAASAHLNPENDSLDHQHTKTRA